MNKTKVRVYDWPVRFFHWVFVILFISAFFIAKTFDDDSAQYPYHMILGIILAFTVLFRIIWGFTGSRYARFSSFKLQPRGLIIYVKDIFNKKAKVYPGHNPASSWAAIIMMFCSIGLAVTGCQMVDGQKETFEDIHELFAHLFLVSAIAHVAGVIFHSIRHKDMIGLSMFSGKKQLTETAPGIEKNYFTTGLMFLLITAFFGIYLINNYDPQTTTLKVFGQTKILGENEDDDD